MTRSEDPPGNIKHLRFGKISDAAYKALIVFPGIKSVVLHTHGAKGEHPHWHVWWIGDKAVTNQTIRDRLKKLPEFKDYSGQNDWSFRNHDSFTKWAEYVTDNLSHKVLLDHEDLAARSLLKAMAPLVTVGAQPPPPTVSPPMGTSRKSASRLRWDEKMCIDAETRLLWKRDEQFSITAVEAGTAIKAVQKQVVSFMRSRINNNEAVKYARNMLYEFGDDDVKEYMEEKLWHNFVWI